eukprot:5813160-Prymnesium_polylepis.1
MPHRYSAKIILGNLNHDITSDVLKRELSRLAKGVEGLELQVAHQKDGRIASVNGIVTFSKLSSRLQDMAPARAARSRQASPS